MSDPFSSSPGRILSLLALAAACAGLRCMGDAPAPPVDPSIEAAKKDFSALKRPATNLDDKADLPRLDVPTLDPALYNGLPAQEPSKSASASSQKTGTQRGQKEDEKSANWLLRAMDKEAERDGSAEPRADRDAPVKTPSPDEDVKMEDAATEGPKETADSRKPDASSQAGNPLAAFMTQWVSSRDQAVLSSKEIGGSANGAPTSTEAPEAALPGGIEALPSIEGLAPLAESLASQQAPDKPAANPYLALLEAPIAEAAAAPALAATPTAEPASAPSFGAGPQLPPAASLADPGAAPPIPDFARPSDDDKYFPQLKRF